MKMCIRDRRKRGERVERIIHNMKCDGIDIQKIKESCEAVFTYMVKKNFSLKEAAL